MAGTKKNLRYLGTGRWKNLRIQVLTRDSYTCQYCEAPATHVDHVMPLALGGDPFDMNNLVASCKACNLRKGKRVFFARQSTPPAFVDNSLSFGLKDEKSPFKSPE